MLKVLNADFGDFFDAALECEAGVVEQDGRIAKGLNYRSMKAANLAICEFGIQEMKEM
jgi:hypothetical protein